MSLVATLICNPADPALDSTMVDGALAILPSPGHAQWLFDEVAVDIPFTGSADIRAIEHSLRAARAHGRPCRLYLPDLRRVYPFHQRSCKNAWVPRTPRQ